MENMNGIHGIHRKNNSKNSVYQRVPAGNVTICEMENHDFE